MYSSHAFGLAFLFLLAQQVLALILACVMVVSWNFDRGGTVNVEKKR